MGRVTVKGPKGTESPLQVTVIVSLPTRPDTTAGVKLNRKIPGTPGQARGGRPWIAATTLLVATLNVADSPEGADCT